MNSQSRLMPVAVAIRSTSATSRTSVPRTRFENALGTMPTAFATSLFFTPRTLRPMRSRLATSWWKSAPVALSSMTVALMCEYVTR
ncbi:hypothetical protein EB74_34010 [Mycobacterium sp. SWH-M5]|nr:hypothetical protein EB74_34010 [Mycobacterium sp. SWH-M5]